MAKVNCSHLVSAMSQAPPKLEERVKTFFSLYRFKLFHQAGDYVACYGEPAMADDGWIINLPASYFFKDDYQSLPFETDLIAGQVQAQSIINQPLDNYVSLNESGASWTSKASALGIPNYAAADLFRDIASLLISYNQRNLALSFIKVAHDLRPEGPVIKEMLAGLTSKCL